MSEGPPYGYPSLQISDPTDMLSVGQRYAPAVLPTEESFYVDGSFTKFFHSPRCCEARRVFAGRLRIPVYLVAYDSG